MTQACIDNILINDLSMYWQHFEEVIVVVFKNALDMFITIL